MAVARQLSQSSAQTRLPVRVIVRAEYRHDATICQSKLRAGTNQQSFSRWPSIRLRRLTFLPFTHDL